MKIGRGSPFFFARLFGHKALGFSHSFSNEKDVRKTKSNVPGPWPGIKTSMFVTDGSPNRSRSRSGFAEIHKIPRSSEKHNCGAPVSHPKGLRSGAPLGDRPWKHFSDFHIVFAKKPLRSRIGGPRIPPGEGFITFSLLFHLGDFSFELTIFDVSASVTGGSPEDDGEIFILRLPLSGCDACGLLWTPHSNRQAPINSSVPGLANRSRSRSESIGRFLDSL